MSKRVLLIKLTSMGDLTHALPALTDAANAIPGIEFDWVVDEAFADVPSWHPNVNQIITSAHRRWKKHLWQSLTSGQLTEFYRQLNAGDYDVVLDAQNNIKSATITWLRRGPSHGLDKHSARERPAHWAYTFHHHTDKSLHAITRQRQLFAKALDYPPPSSAAEYGIDASRMHLPDMDLPKRYVFFVHNASWTTKLWPQQQWRQLTKNAQQSGYHVLLPCGNDEELLRAQQLAKGYDHAIALPKLPLSQVAALMSKAQGAICCDTGLAHIAGMLGIPAVSFYGPTDHRLIGATGLNQYHCVADKEQFGCAPCYKKRCDFYHDTSETAACMASFKADDVWHRLLHLIAEQAQNPTTLQAIAGADSQS